MRKGQMQLHVGDNSAKGKPSLEVWGVQYLFFFFVEKRGLIREPASSFLRKEAGVDTGAMPACPRTNSALRWLWTFNLIVPTRKPEKFLRKPEKGVFDSTQQEIVANINPEHPVYPISLNCARIP